MDLLKKNRICPVERAGGLDNTIRRWLQTPHKILQPYVHTGMTVLDLGCGPGFFSLEMGRLVGHSGRIIAADVQQGMLTKVQKKIRGTDLEDRITLHQCGQDRIGIAGPVDFVLAFYMLHEVPRQDALFGEMTTILKIGGKMLIVEPPLHVSRQEFGKTLEIARGAGFAVMDGPKILFGRTAILTNSQEV
ncbi:MAG: class I SAM-dependent methyltransferase [Desulfocapsaceae bacterium]|nr:class I SAM-dependent methyltransferase [Desulfocapsaceae bacterium]